ncbi:MAG TPA: DNA gyrase subunit A, partial [Lentisphaerae bacterium]|nr:DNA gyrase subunit A [Lentisphaerota bacterium]
KNTVDMRPNFDESRQEPVVLPARFPNLLVNGATGIAVGMATNIPPHNLGEVIDAIIHLVDHPDCTPRDLMRFIKGPDFPTGGIICGTAPLQSMYETGRGLIKVRGRAVIEEDDRGRQSIVITEIPFGVNKAGLITKIASLVQSQKLEGISDIRDESDKEGMRVVIELKKNAIPRVVLNNIFKHTALETTFGAILLAIDHGRPRTMNLKELLECFVKHRFEVLTRRSQYELEKAEARAHVLEGLKIALDHLDAVVRIIRQSRSRESARDKLMSRYGLSQIQADAILDMRLYQLTGLERDKLEEEYVQVIKRINYLRDLLASERKMFGLLKEDLLEIRNAYADERMTEIGAEEGELDVEDLIADQSCVIAVTHGGYVKRTPVSVYRQQSRGGKGLKGMETKETDYVEQVFAASTHDYLLVLTSTGRLHWIKVYQIPEAGRVARGKAIVNLLNITSDEKPAAMINVRSFDEDHYLVMATASGLVKRTPLTAFSRPRSGGIIAMGIYRNDTIIGADITTGSDDILLVTRNGKSIRFNESDLRPQGRTGHGVRGIRLAGKNDCVVGLEIVHPNATLLVVTENGFGKRTAFSEYPVQHRGGQGVIAIRTSARNGRVVSALSVHDGDAVMLTTTSGQMIRIPVSDIRTIRRNTQGVRLINLSRGDKLVSATKVESVEDLGETKNTGTAEG